jgi:hypothetical protein
VAARRWTEAGVERIFSKTGFIHNELRNRINHELVVAMTRNSMNAEGFDGFVNNGWIWDFADVADGLADIDEVGYDAE